MSITNSIKYVTENNSLSDVEVYESHARLLASEVERLTSIINNIPHGRRKYAKDAVIRDSIFEAKTGDYIYIFATDETMRVGSEPSDFYVPEEEAVKLIENNDAVRLPPKMVAKRGKYHVLDGLIVSYSIQELDEDGSFHDWMYIWIPKKNEGKYVELCMRLLGNDRFGDRIFLDTSHFGSESGWENPYTTKTLRRAGAYEPYVKGMLDLYRKVTNRPNFLK